MGDAVRLNMFISMHTEVNGIRVSYRVPTAFNGVFTDFLREDT
jgi:hypothetical protein